MHAVLLLSHSHCVCTRARVRGQRQTHLQSDYQMSTDDYSKALSLTDLPVRHQSALLPGGEAHTIISSYFPTQWTANQARDTVRTNWDMFLIPRLLEVVCTGLISWVSGVETQTDPELSITGTSWTRGNLTPRPLFVSGYRGNCLRNSEPCVTG